MSAPTFAFDEYNGATGSVTENVGALVFASVDQPSNTDGLIAYGIAPAQNSYEKWMKIRVVSAAPSTLTNFMLNFSNIAPIDSIGNASISVLFGSGATYPPYGPTTGFSTVAVNFSLNTSLALGLDNTVGATTVFITLQLQASLGAQPGPFTFPSNFIYLSYAWT